MAHGYEDLTATPNVAVHRTRFVSKWFLSACYRSLHPLDGDILEHEIGENIHTMIYVGRSEDGEPMVIHLYKNLHLEQKQEYRVRCDTLHYVLASVGKVRINNWYDDDHNPRNGDEIVKDAFSKLGKTYRDGNLYSSDHFVSLCRYGVPVSRKNPTLYQQHRRYQYFTDFMDPLSLCRFLNVGDLVEFFGKSYQHWAIYAGKQMIWHLWVVDGKIQVRTDNIEFVSGGRLVRKNNKYDERAKPKLPDEIMAKAIELSQTDVHYMLTQFNCEHAATLCRYGIQFSDQARKKVQKIEDIVMTVIKSSTNNASN